MALYYHRWNDGDVSIVEAKNKVHACSILDELADCSTDDIHLVGGRDFFVTFTPVARTEEETEDGELALRLAEDQGDIFRLFADEMASQPSADDQECAALVEEYHLTLDELKARLSVGAQQASREFAEMWGVAPKNKEESLDSELARIAAMTDADQARGKEYIAERLRKTRFEAALTDRPSPALLMEIADLLATSGNKKHKAGAVVLRAKAQAAEKRAAASRRNGQLGGRPREKGKKR